MVETTRLLLPAAARQWSGEQLRSVLLHEVAHIKRRDTIAHLLAQIACSLHWFNPLVWFAAWRLRVESERACDDLVLASGVRLSSYAGHLLQVATRPGNCGVMPSGLRAWLSKMLMTTRTYCPGRTGR